MNDRPTVSVLMTAYNREKHIGAAIESVLIQTFSDWELVIVDDVSTDRTCEIARQYAARDDRIRIIENEQNLGDYPNRNHAATFARGRYIKYHDSDDVMYPYCLSTMVELLESAPEAAIALSSGWNWEGGPCPMLLSPRMAYEREFLGSGMFYLGPGGALFRTEVFHDLGGFPERGSGSDHGLWLRACARYSVLLAPGNLFWYRLHSNQSYGSYRSLCGHALDLGEEWRALNAPECPLDGAALVRAKNKVAWGVARLTWRDLRAGRWEVARIRLVHAGLSWRDWLRYLRRPRPNQFAGTPLDADGEYIIPEWLSSPQCEPVTSCNS